MNSSQRIRSRVILGVISCGALCIAVALYWTQGVKGAEYAARAESQYVKPAAALFARGSIYFESKDSTRAAAASVGSGFLVYVNPKLIKDPAATFQAISQYVDIDKAQFLAKATKPNDAYEEIARRQSADVAESVRSLAIPGLGVQPETWRTYPGEKLASHAIGLVGQDGVSSTIVGRYGLERSYEDVLSRSSSGPSVNVFAGIFSGLSGALGSGKEGNIITSIDPTVQAYLERTLANAASTWRSDEIGGIVMDPRTGEIIAMASLPDFNPNNVSSVRDASIFSNPLVEHVYEMGSIIKPLTMAAALDSGAVTPSSTYDDTGSMTLSGKKIANYDGKARGVVSMQEILSQSLNVGAATIALKVGKEDFERYFTSYGIGKKTGIDLPSEAAGVAGNLASGRDIEIATAAYGQGIAISPVATVRALAVLANGGRLVTPHAVKEIDYEDGTIEKVAPEPSAPIFKPGTTDEVTKMLVTVVDKKIAAAHPDIFQENYSIAAKTGTAQIPDHVHGGYYPDRYLHSFFGYFPAYEPRYLVFLYQIHPKGAQYASETLTEPFADLTKFLISYFDVAPDR